MKLIDKDALIVEIENLLDKNRYHEEYDCAYRDGNNGALYALKSKLNILEVKEVDLYNNGWIDCFKQMPKETKQWSDTLQGHREWTESDLVLAWDSMYGCRIDCTKNGKWMSEQRGGCTGQVVHSIIAWRPIPEFSEEFLLKAQKGE